MHSPSIVHAPYSHKGIGFLNKWLDTNLKMIKSSTPCWLHTNISIVLCENHIRSLVQRTPQKKEGEELLLGKEKWATVCWAGRVSGDHCCPLTLLQGFNTRNQRRARPQSRALPAEQFLPLPLPTASSHLFSPICGFQQTPRDRNSEYCEIHVLTDGWLWAPHLDLLQFGSICIKEKLACLVSTVTAKPSFREHISKILTAPYQHT